MVEFEIIEERLYSHTIEAESLKDAIAQVEDGTAWGTFIGTTFYDAERDDDAQYADSSEVPDEDGDDAGQQEIDRIKDEEGISQLGRHE